MNATDLKNHLREMMTGTTEDLVAHLREMGVEGTLPRQKQALVKLHADHHGSAPLTGSEAVGKTVKPEPAKVPAPKPARKAPAAKAAPVRKAPAKPAAAAEKPAPARRARASAKAPAAPAKPAPARRARASAKPATPAKPATRTRKAPAKPAPAPAANGSATANANKHDLAKRLIDMVAEWAKDESPENKAKLAYWLHGLPTGYPNGGGGGYLRYWPAGLPKPTTAGWRPPAAK